MQEIKIKSIKKIKTPSLRYELEITDNHNFFCNNILKHNCKMEGQSFTVVPTFKGKKLTAYIPKLTVCLYYRHNKLVLGKCFRM